MSIDSLPLGLKPTNGKPYLCMLIDDSRTMRLLLKQILLSLKFEVILEAENGAEALEKIDASEQKPELVFIDVEMPQMSGVELLRRLRNTELSAKYLMVTGNTDPDTVKQIISLGISGYIVKPFDRETVIEKLEKILAVH